MLSKTDGNPFHLIVPFLAKGNTFAFLITDGWMIKNIGASLRKWDKSLSA
ncbi:hypothetical protein STRDD12_00240 [Streptococcus sp. DD12]|nr:hypothetical protein STRDD12_00240 [Streptococcus sp. DD12]